MNRVTDTLAEALEAMAAGLQSRTARQSSNLSEFAQRLEKALNPTKFGPVLFNEPGAPADFLADVPRGRMAPDQVVRLLQDVAAASDVVGFAIAEYMPWEAITTRNLFRKLPLPPAKS